MKKTKKPLLFRIIKGAVRLVYPKFELEGTENLPEDPCVIVGNHSQLHGPIVGELYLPENCHTWCAGEMMHFKDVPAYAFRDFWSHKPKWTHPFYKLISYLIAPLAVLLFNHARTIAVYHDARLMTTFRQTIAKLQNGENVVIYPEHDVKHNNILYDFQTKFVDFARLYVRKTGKMLSFVPMYIAPKLRKLFFGTPIPFCPLSDIAEERGRICRVLMERITAIARALPKHVVIPYRNVPKKNYLTNLDVDKLPQD